MAHKNVSETNYLAYKVKILKQLGLTDTKATEAYLANASRYATTETKRQIQIDNAAKTLLFNFYDGDRTYTDKRKGN